jgi:hypothetical protein
MTAEGRLLRVRSARLAGGKAGNACGAGRLFERIGASMTAAREDRLAQQTSDHRDAAARMGLPDGISRHHIEGRQGMLRAVLPVVLLGGLLLAALLGAFGGTKDPTLGASGDGASLTIGAPRTLRSGMFFEIDIVVDARRAIAKPVVAISRSYLHDLTVNTHLPEPEEMGFEEGRFTMTFPAMQPGDRLVVKIDGQVNPTLIGVNRGTIAIHDDKLELASRAVSLRVLP